MTIIHPHGNIRITFTKRFAHILSSSIFFIFKIFYPKIDTKTNGIIISRATPLSKMHKPSQYKVLY